MGATPEGKVKAKLDNMLKEFEPELWFFSPQSGIYGRSGIPDRIAVMYGQTIGIECKAKRDAVPTDLQIACMKAMSRAGAKCYIVGCDGHIAVVKDYLVALKARERLLS